MWFEAGSKTRMCDCVGFYCSFNVSVSLLEARSFTDIQTGKLYKFEYMRLCGKKTLATCIVIASINGNCIYW